MHAVVEVNGPTTSSSSTSGSTRGTLVNGEQDHQGPAARRRRDQLRRRPRGRELRRRRCLEVRKTRRWWRRTWRPPPRPSRPARPPSPPPAAPSTPPPPPPTPPAAVYAAAAAYAGAAAAAAAAAPRRRYAAAPAFASRLPPANPVAAEVEVHDGTRAIEVQALYRGVVVNTRHLLRPGRQGHLRPGQAACSPAASPPSLVGLGRLPRHRRRRGQGEGRLRGAPRRRQGVASLQLEAPLAGPGRRRVPGLGRRPGASSTWASSAAARRHHDYVIGADPERRRARGRRVHRRRRRTPWSAIAGSDFVVNVTPQMTGEVARSTASRIPLQHVRPAARRQLLAARARPRPHRLRRDHLPGQLDPEAARARGALPDLEVERAGLHGRLGGRPAAVPADDLLGSAGPQVAVARPVQLRQPLRELPDQAAGGEGRGDPRVAQEEGPRRAGRQGQAPQGRRRQDGEEDLQEQGGSVRPQGPEGQPRSPPGQEAGRGRGQERRHPRRAQDGRGLAHRLDLRSRHGARHRRRERARRPDRQPDRRGLRRRRSRSGRHRRRRRRHRRGHHRPRQPRHHRQGRRRRLGLGLRPRRRRSGRSSGQGARTSSPARPTCAARSTRRSSAASSGATSTR